MSDQGKPDQFRLGFLAAIEIPERGYVGGLLVTNRYGRPLEFQCTTPVRPNRTQEILYGPTLGPYVLTELIGRTLVERTSIKPDLILTEQAELLELREQVELPVACVDSQQTDAADSANGGETVAVAAGVKLGTHRLRFHDAHADDGRRIERGAALVPRDADLREPFDRVREALQETVRAGAMW